MDTIIHEDAWLGAILGRPAFRIDAVAADPDAGAVTQHARSLSAAFHYARLPTESVEQARCLARAGLYVVDVNVTLAREPGSVDSGLCGGSVVADTTPGQQLELLAIAGSCFRYSRFHLDPLIPTALAHRIKHEWVANCLRGARGEAVLAATLDGRTAGFLTVVASRREGSEVRTIDLVGVATDLQGRGVGRALVAAFIHRYTGHCDRLEVGTQAANVPSLRLYESLGFRIARTAYVMHGHVGPPLAA